MPDSREPRNAGFAATTAGNEYARHAGEAASGAGRALPAVDVGAILNGIPGHVSTFTAAGELEFVNRQVVEYFGRTLDELKDWRTLDAIHPDDLPHAIASWTRSIETGEPFETEHRRRRADGVYRWFQVRGRPIRNTDGRIDRWVNLMTDIEDRKRAEDALRASESDFRLILDSIPGLVATNTPTGETELVNRQMMQYFGRSLEELKGWRTIDAVHPYDRPRVVDIIATWMGSTADGGPYEFDLRLRRADGAYRWFHLRALRAVDAEGSVLRWYHLLTDIDDRKRADRRLRRAVKARYEAVLAERTRIARDMHDGLLQDITGIALQLGAILPHVRATPDAAAERLERVLESIQRASRAARQAVAGMRSRSESADLVLAVREETQRLTNHAGLALSIRVAGHTRLVPALVRDATISIVHEAITNVVKHASARLVKVSVTFGRRRLRLTVTDDGRGLTVPEVAGAEHFGLIGMRERAMSIGASFQVSSVPRRGTTVGLSIPLAGRDALDGSSGP